MRSSHASLSRRLLFGAAVFIALALIVAGGFIGFALRRFITGQIDQRLDSQIVSVASAIETGPRGQVQMTRDVDGPPFNRQQSGWYWQVLGTNLKSRSLGAENLAPELKKERLDEARPFPSDQAGPFDEPLHLRIQRRRVGESTVIIAVSAPRAALNGPLREAMTTLAISLGVLGLGLLLAIFLQVRLGLRPLRRLRDDLADVAAGRLERVPAQQPEEVRPVVAEMNTLLDQNAAGLARARRHVANLAHGLKTPLTTLSLALAEPGRDQDGSLRRLATLMDRRIRHHLGRAKAAAQDGPARARTQVLRHAVDFGEAFSKIYAGKGVKFDLDVPAGLTVACEAQDLDEMLGNLLDNAFKWSRGNVKVSASEAGSDVVIAIQDDGAGLSEGELPEALLPGRRLDESVPGYGFGLPITRELAELYGGSLSLSRSGLGGLKAELRLPRGGALSPSA
jgi:signal transduction histidine kinase